MSFHHADILPSWNLSLRGETRLPHRGKTRDKAWLGFQFCGPETKSWKNSEEGRHPPGQTIGWPSLLGKSPFPGRLGWLVILPSERRLMPFGRFLQMATFSLYRPTYAAAAESLQSCLTLCNPPMTSPQLWLLLKTQVKVNWTSIFDPNLFS